MLPAYYEHFKIKENDYKNWRETEKESISFDFLDKQSSHDFLKTNCNFKFKSPEPKSIFVSNKNPYYTDFNLSVEMNCNQLTKTKNKLDPQSLEISYRMECPKHFNTDRTRNY
jgi:hypothetical protein